MKISELSTEELEGMGYDEVAYLILKESGKKMKINDLFRSVCEALDYDVEAYQDKIADFFELLSTNKKFVMLKSGFWDLQSKHKPEIIIEDNDEDEFVEPEEVDDEDDDEDEENIFFDGDETDDVEDDDLADLAIVDEEEETSA